MTTVYVGIHDSDKTGKIYPKTVYEFDQKLFESWQDQGFGIYKAVNDFEATPEELLASGKKTLRNDIFCKKLVAVYADLDIAKSGDESTEQQREEAKKVLIENVNAWCPPNKIIVTKNGIQPLWFLQDTSIENAERYRNVICGIIEWSKGEGSAGDAVKDLARVLRVPGFYHLKTEPYMVTEIEYHDFLYTYEDLEELFPFTPAPKKEYTVKEKVYDAGSIDTVDFQAIVIRAFQSTGHTASFDDTQRLILDGRLTGTFQDRRGDRRYLSSTSHEPYTGNQITVVSCIRGCTNEESAAWIKDEFNLNPKKEDVIYPFQIKDPETGEDIGYFKTSREIYAEMQSPKILVHKADIISTGFPEVDKVVGGIVPTSLVVVGARTGHGKSEVCKNIAVDAASKGKKVLFFDFENDSDEMLSRELKTALAMRAINIMKTDIKTFEFWEKYKKFADEAAQEFFEKIGDNLRFYGKDDIPTIDQFLKILDTVEKADLIVIDHLHYFSIDETQAQAVELAKIMRKARMFTKIKRIPVVMASHAKEPIGKERPPIASDLFGSSNIAKEATFILMPYRIPFAEYIKDNEGRVIANTLLFVSKNRPEGPFAKFEANYDTRFSTLKIKNQEGF